MNTQNLLKVLGGALVVVFLGVSAFKTNTVNVNLPQDNTTFGATPTLDGVDFPRVSINGNVTYFANQNFAATSTRLCRIKNPLAATSTIVSFTARVTSGILGANTFSLGTSSSAAQGYATSTPALMFEHTVATGAQDQVYWNPLLSSATTSLKLLPAMNPTTGENNAILGPNEYLVLALGSTTAGTVNAVYYSGYCQAELKKL